MHHQLHVHFALLTSKDTASFVSVPATMAASTESQPRGSLEFVESSVLEAVVPLSSDVDIKEDLSSWDGTADGESGSILPFLSQRNVLLLGMHPYIMGISMSLTHAQASR
jgi:hypothetical protein